MGRKHKIGQSYTQQFMFTKKQFDNPIVNCKVTGNCEKLMEYVNASFDSCPVKIVVIVCIYKFRYFFHFYCNE